MLIKRSDPIPSSEITPESVYQSRRQFITTTGLVAGGILLNSSLLSGAIASGTESGKNFPGSPLQYQPVDRNKPGYFADEKLTPNEDVVRYNNFYEFGTDKGDPARYGQSLKTSPWSVVVDGEVAKPGRYHLEDLLAKQTLEERVYRLRCVEAWSMVIPWVGFPLADLLRQFEPTSRARYVAFATLYDPDQLRGQRSRTGVIDWPYREALRMDEAMHPLSLIAVGLYGKTLLPQNGAPLRLVVPWKYGFKSIKSIVRISLTEQRPETSWENIAPNEYGFYANVNPDVDHPRWSQKTEKRLPTSLFNPTRIATQLFNGYAEQVASLYKGMDLKRFF